MKRRSIFVGLVAVAATLGALSISCGSLAKEEMERRLLALDKNADARGHGLSRGRVVWTTDGVERAEDVVFLHAPALEPIAGLPPIVLIHGTPATLFTWTRVIFGGDGYDGLRRYRDVYALEVIGHGIAPTSEAPDGFEGCGDFVAAFAAQVGTPMVDLVGNSYGGEFCLDVAIDHPELVRRMALLDSSGVGRSAEEFLPEEVAMREMWLAPHGWLLNARDRIATALVPHFDPPPSADQIDEVFLVCENRGNWATMVDLARDENGDREAELAQVRAKTLLLWGDRDIAYPATKFGKRFDDLIPDSELIVLPNCGHYPQEEHPAAVVRHLDEFFTKK